MRIKNARQFPSAFQYGKTVAGEQFMSFLVKATFSMNARRAPATVAALQLPILTVDEPYQANAPGSLLRFESDLVPYKPRADIVLVGSAYAPRGQPTKSLDVEIRVGSLQRIIRVTGDRMWSFPVADQHAPICVGPAEFTKIPLTYDRAFGGIDKHAQLNPQVPRFRPWCAQNFAGKGFIGSLSVDSVHKTALPNLEDPNDLIRGVSNYPAPTGCGFFPRGNEPRSKYAGTFDERWKAERAPELPEDFRFEVYNGAHPLLQVDGFLVGNEPVVLSNVSPAQPRFEFLLPGIRPRLTARAHPWPADAPAPDTKAKLTTREVTLNLDTVVFVPDDGVFFQIWRALIPIRDPAALEVAEVQVEYDAVALHVGQGDRAGY
jgi:hypothetical protein